MAHQTAGPSSLRAPAGRPSCALLAPPPAFAAPAPRAPQPRVSRGCASSPRGAASVPHARAPPRLSPAPRALGFDTGDDDDASLTSPPLVVPPPKALFGLSPSQMGALGLVGGAAASRTRLSRQAAVSARASYSQEVPSLSHPPPRAVTAMRASGGGGGPAQAPPDLPSLLLNARICYLGMPLVASVTELLIAELLWLNFDNPEKPVFFYVNSTGSQSVDGKAVASETEAYAILDTLQYIRPDIHTVCVGRAHGNAAMLLASGKPGCRYALPNASIALQAPRMNRKVDVATNLMISSNELEANTATYLDFVADYCGRTKEEVVRDVARTRYFTPQGAISYGLIDRVISPQSGGLGAALQKVDYEGQMKRQQAAEGGRTPAYASRERGD